MSPDGDEGRTDEPIGELRGLSVEPSPSFAERLRRRIERRETSNHLLVVAWHVPLAVLLAFLEMTFSLLSPKPGDRGGSQ
jgi:hypothetical protein